MKCEFELRSQMGCLTTGGSDFTGPWRKQRVFGQREEPLGEGLKVSRPTSTPHLDGAAGQDFEASCQRGATRDVQTIEKKGKRFDDLENKAALREAERLVSSYSVT